MMAAPEAATEPAGIVNPGVVASDSRRAPARWRTARAHVDSSTRDPSPDPAGTGFSPC